MIPSLLIAAAAISVAVLQIVLSIKIEKAWRDSIERRYGERPRYISRWQPWKGYQ